MSTPRMTRMRAGSRWVLEEGAGGRPRYDAAHELVAYPHLPAYPRKDGCGLRVWCCWCGRWHLHGQDYGHRVAHCWTASPYQETGYVLVDPAKLERRA